MMAGYTRTTLPTLHQRALPQQLLRLRPVLPQPGVKQTAATVTVIATVASADAIKDFPLGFVLAYPHPGFIQRPALFLAFFFTLIFRGVYCRIWTICLGNVPSHGTRPLFRRALQSLC